MTRSSLLDKVRGALELHALLEEGDTVVLGVSGGMDSMTLLDLFSQLRGSWRLGLVIAHVNHGLRGEESAREFRFVEGQAFRYGVPFQGKVLSMGDAPVQGNLQAEARKSRYQFFDEVARKWGARKIATGHHREDQVETLLLQIFRGTGGLKGIPRVRGERYIRPLLDVSRRQIEAYVHERKIPYCEDSSNREGAYLRNRIRHELIPWIRREINPRFEESLLRLSSLLQEDADYLEGMAREAFPGTLGEGAEKGELVLHRNLLESMPPVLQKRLLRLAYQRIQGSSASLSHVHLAPVCFALSRRARGGPKRFPLPNHVDLFLEPEQVRFSRACRGHRESYSYPFGVGSSQVIPEAGLKVCSSEAETRAFSNQPRPGPFEAYLDEEVCRGEMRLRSFQPGDRFIPLGLGGEKKLQDFFVDEKVPWTRRHTVPLLEVGSRIAWVVGYRIDDRFKVTPVTRRCVHVEAVRVDSDGRPEDQRRGFGFEEVP